MAGHDKRAVDRREQKVPIVDAESIVRTLPEVGFCIRLDA